MKSKTLLLLGLLALPTGVGASPFEADGRPQASLSDEDLSELRGGFELPGGLIVNLGVTTDTIVDGRLVLRTVFTATEGAPTLRIFGRSGDSPSELNLAAGEVSTGDGVVRLHDLPAGARVELAGNGVDISHVVGQAFGTALANSGSDRTIDAVTTVDLTISHASPDLIGSSLLQVEGAALDSTRLLAR